MPKAILDIMPKVLFSSNNMNEKWDHRKELIYITYSLYTYVMFVKNII